MCKAKCEECEFFVQHYGHNERRFFRVHCGHCTFSKTKKKSPDMRACEHFTPSPAITDTFVTKEYLSRELLQYLLKLELLPEIE